MHRVCPVCSRWGVVLFRTGFDDAVPLQGLSDAFVLAIGCQRTVTAIIGLRLLLAVIDAVYDDTGVTAFRPVPHQDGRGTVGLVVDGFLIVTREVAVMRVLRLGQFCLSHVEGVLIDLLLLHHGGKCDLILIEGDAVEVARLTFVLRVLLDDDLGEFVVGDEVFLADEFVEDVDGVQFLPGIGTVHGFPFRPLTLFDQVEQLEHTVIFPQLLHDLLMFEINLIGFLQSAVEVLELIIEFHFLLDEGADADQDVLDRCLTVDLLDLNAAEILQFLEVTGAFIDAAAEIVHVCLGGEEQDHIGGDFEGFQDYFVQSRVEVGHEDVLVLSIVMELCQRRLDYNHIDIPPIQVQKLPLTQFYIGIHFVNLGVIQQKPHLFLTLLIGDDLHTGIDIRQFDSIPSYPRIGIEDNLRSIALTSDVLGDLFGRVDGP